jgi:hypothetical protein
MFLLILNALFRKSGDGILGEAAVTMVFDEEKSSPSSVRHPHMVTSHALIMRTKIPTLVDLGYSPWLILTAPSFVCLIGLSVEQELVTHTNNIEDTGEYDSSLLLLHYHLSSLCQEGRPREDNREIVDYRTMCTIQETYDDHSTMFLALVT